MTERITLGVIMNGVTGRMGRIQHLARSIMAIRAQGGVPAGDGTVIWPEPLLVGRNPERLRRLAGEHGLPRWSNDLDASLSDPAFSVYFDAQTTDRRAPAVRAAIAAGKHVYCEKPTATDLETALDLARAADGAGIRHGVVQDKLWLPGLLKLRRVIDSGALGRVLAVRLDFGYWVFEGGTEAAQRPSWNYRREDGGGIVLDMYCHWRYLLDDLFGGVRSVYCRAVTHIPERIDEGGERYAATADDAAYGVLELENGAIAHATSSWCTRVRRDDLLVLHVDGSHGSAVAGLRQCWLQPRAATPALVWNPDVPQPVDLQGGWMEVPEAQPAPNAFRAEWELFLRHVAVGDPFPWDLYAAARGVQLAEIAARSSDEGRVLPVPDLRR
ncbi:MAG TPA: Gfo/Idh/MocA family oxidoreductase [Candidatus Dormibacteraeota bacterium]|jgi:predicted dehydrogenase|nr:Gfo/Idh/MocA family oxidoreductase [Candidatus Dormibacteraeota bacterium]